MRAVRLIDGDITVCDVEPSVPEYVTDPVTVHVTSCSICGSDLHLRDLALTCTFGHEFGGLLDDGTVVAVQPFVPCGECDQCLRGSTARCRRWVERYHGISVDGGMADTVVVDRACLAYLPESVRPEDAALVEPIGIDVHAANRAGLTGAGAGTDGEPVLVIGAGSIGLTMAAVLRHRGYDVHVAARHHAQRAAAERVGAGIDVGDEYGVVVDAAGTQSSIDLATNKLVPGGRLVVVGYYWDPVAIGLELLTKEVTVVPATMYGHRDGRREFEDAVAVLAANPHLPEVLVTHRFGLDDAADAFRAAGDRAAGAIKVVVEP
jgi:2-desacetyl-2-hydroxyethyl bacteriochlorophyllide A dehydrogenase